jgi:3-phenylpropionate/cinnamic acid dioxygenase small subunit
MTEPTADPAITALAFRYARVIDTRDWQLIGDCFTPDAVAHYSTGSYAGLDAIDALFRGLFERLDGTHHLVSNVEARIAGDTATARSNFQAAHVRSAATGGTLFTTAGVYEDSLVRTPAGWRIAERRTRLAWAAGNRAVMGEDYAARSTAPR